MSAELAGAWRLESFEDLDADGGRHEGPLGPSPSGLLLYTPDGHVAVAMAGSGYMSYAGRWHRDGDRVVHTIRVAPDPDWVGSEQVRELSQDGDRLVLTGRGPSGSPVRRRLTWRRAD